MEYTDEIDLGLACFFVSHANCRDESVNFRLLQGLSGGFNIVVLSEKLVDARCG